MEQLRITHLTYTDIARIGRLSGVYPRTYRCLITGNGHSTPRDVWEDVKRHRKDAIDSGQMTSEQYFNVRDQYWPLVQQATRNLAEELFRFGQLELSPGTIDQSEDD